MANTYLELKTKHQEEVNNFPMAFAFNMKQFEEAMQKLGLTINDTDKIYKIPGRGLIRKTDSPKLKELLDRLNNETKAAIDNDKTGDGFIFEMFDYELANHEYCITGSVDETLDGLGITKEQVKKNPALLHGLNKAIKAQRYNGE